MEGTQREENILHIRKIVSLKERRSVKEGSSLEEMIPLSGMNLRLAPLVDMKPYTGNEIFVRKKVAEKLSLVNHDLGKKNLRLLVVYGYRHPEIQKKYFNEMLEKLRPQNPDLSEEELVELVDNFVAVPEVAGHPTGAAVDVILVDSSGNEIDMGTPILGFDDPEKILVFSDTITDEQKKFRMILRESMMSQGFAPFNGEWWHFSFGDREWGFWNKKSESIYDQIDFTANEEQQ